MNRIILLLITLALSACVTPARLGISESEWGNLTPEEQAKIKQGYFEVKKNKTAGQEKIIPDGSVVHLRVSGGKVGMPPFASAYDYTPFEVDVHSGECQNINVKELHGDKTVGIQVCYFNKTVYLDPSRYDPNKSIGSIQLHYSPIWDRGFTYQNVSSSGYAHFNNVNVAVRRSSNNEPTDSEN